MNKKYIDKSRLRRLFSALMIGAMTLTLTGCSNSYNRYPTGNIDVDALYASIGDKTVTKGQLWNELRYSANNVLTSQIEKAVLSSYITKITEVMSGDDTETKLSYAEKLKGYVINGIYSVEDDEAVEALAEATRKLSAEKYLDDLYQNNFDYFNDYVKAGKALPDVNNIVKDCRYDLFYKYYYTDLAKELLAYDKLEEEIAEHDADLDDDDDPYYTMAEKVAYFKNHYQNTGDVEAVIIRFMNENEVNETLKAFGIKTFKSTLYYIPGKANMSYAEYSKYYDEVSSSDITSSKDGINGFDQLATEAGVLELYIEMYNYVYTYRDSLPNTNSAWTSENLKNKDRRNITEAIIEANKDIEDLEDIKAKVATLSQKLKDNTATSQYTSYTSEELEDINSSLKTYIYDSLFEDTTLEDDSTDEKNRYSTSGRSYGDYYYLTYKISAQEDEHKDALKEDEEGVEYIEGEDLLAEILQGLKDDEVTSSYITSKYDEAAEEVKLSIYDTVLEMSYAASNSDYSKTLKNTKDKNILAQIKLGDETYDILVDETFDQLEAAYGTTTSINILTNAVIKDSNEYKEITKEEEETYKDNLKYMLAMFANDQLSSYGYPSSIGKYNFMILYFHSADVTEIVNNYYKVNAVSSKLINKYEDATLLQKFIDFTNQAQDNYMNTSATRLLVYVDMDEDGQPDTDFDWSKVSDNVSYTVKAQELMDIILKLVEAKTTDHASALTAIVEEYNSSSRFDNGLCKPSADGYDPTAPECTWAEFRRLGLYIKTDAYADITSASDEATIDLSIKEKLLEIYKSGELINHDNVQTEYIYDDEYLTTDEGLNLLVVTSATIASSFEFNVEDFKYADQYVNIPIMYNDEKIIIENLYDDNGNISVNQIRLFIYEYSISQTTSLLPSEISSALTTFFQPVFTRYTASATQNENMLKYLKTATSANIDFKDSYNDARFTEFMLINRKAADNYLSDDDLANNFSGWWTELFGKDGQ